MRQKSFSLHALARFSFDAQLYIQLHEDTIAIWIAIVDAEYVDVSRHARVSSHV